MKSFGSRLQAAPAARAPAALVMGRITRPCMAPRTFARSSPKVVCVASGPQAAAEKKEVVTQPTAPVTFKVFLRINYGEHLRVVGSSEALGGWEVDKAPQMVWNEGHIWTATVDMPVGEQFEFKFVHIMPVRAPVWEATSNRNFKISDTRLQAISTQWNNPMAEYEARAVAVQDAGALELLESPSFSATVSAPAPAEAAPSAAALTQQQEEEQQQQPGAPNSPASEAAVTPAVGTSAPASQMFEEGANYDADVESMFESLEDVTSALTGSLVLPEDSPAAAASAALAPAQPQAPASAAQVPAQPAAGPEGSPAAQPVPAAPTKDAGSLLKTVGRTAGYVAMGVAAGALFSALAVDITEVAVMGAVVAAAGSAALSTGSSTGSKEEGKESKKKKALAAEDGTASVVDVEADVVAGEGSSSGAVLELGSAEEEEGESDGEVAVGAVPEPPVEARRSRPKGSEPAVIMAAAVLHALDSANTVLSSVILSSVSDEEKGSEEEESKQ